jgi:hypothetical protein
MLIAGIVTGQKADDDSGVNVGYVLCSLRLF